MSKQTKSNLGPTGRLIINPTVGPYEDCQAGTKEWAEAMAARVSIVYSDVERGRSVERLVATLKKAHESDPKPWDVWPEETKGSFDLWIKAVTGASWDEVLRVVRIREPNALQLLGGGAPPLAEHGTNQHTEQEGEDITLSSPRQGNSQAYLLRRLARDAPEILERVEAGEFRSARAAAIEAGIIKPVPTVRLTDPSRVAARIKEMWDSDQIEELIRNLTA